MHSKPGKPYEGFPLYAHRNGQWAKRIHGTIRYFGKWDDWRAALELFEKERDTLYAGRTTDRDGGEDLPMADACNAFLTAKELLRDSGEIAERTYQDYKATCEFILAQFGRTRTVESLVVADFDDLRAALAKRFGPVRLTNEITRVRMVFWYVGPPIGTRPTAGLIERPVNFGPNFCKPSARVMRLHKKRSGKRMFTAAELQAVLNVAQEPMRTIILLGINCALGNADVGLLELQHLDLDGGWLNFERNKTGIDRRIRLWPETIAGLRKVLKERAFRRERKRKPSRAWVDPYPTRVFLTKYGKPWHQGTRDNPISREMSKLLDTAGVRRPGLNFYALRHTFQTIGEKSGDQKAVEAIMGHAPHTNDMSAIYREEIEDDRLIRVAQYVHKWLFPPAKKAVKAS